MRPTTIQAMMPPGSRDILSSAPYRWDCLLPDPMANSMPKRAAESPHGADGDADALLAAAFHPPLGEGTLEFLAE